MKIMKYKIPDNWHVQYEHNDIGKQYSILKTSEITSNLSISLKVNFWKHPSGKYPLISGNWQHYHLYIQTYTLISETQAPETTAWNDTIKMIVLLKNSSQQAQHFTDLPLHLIALMRQKTLDNCFEPKNLQWIRN